jgi:pimeloyl-ACP methyl ester carboxylesterase
VPVAVALVAVLLGAPTVITGPGPAAAALDLRPALSEPAQENFSLGTVDYNSSVDGFPLSYSEILPLNYSPSETYPLAIELHGVSTSQSTAMPGGYPTPVVNTTADAAVAAGFIEIVPNTRTGDGYYVDSKYDGPQAQDILDAIAHERSIRHIGKLYLFGFSMGSMGALSIGLNHPGMFAGLGAIAAFSDDFELEARVTSLGNTGLEDAGLLPTGGLWPNSSAYALGIFEELSPLRFHPQNASGLPIWLAGGGDDVFATNNPALWPYEQANDSVLDSTCLVASSVGEPANCTVPLAALRAEDPADYSYRYVFEPNGIHDYDLLNATDMFAYFDGQAPPGEYWGSFPDPTLLPEPIPLVTVVAEPAGCGSIALNGTPVPSLETIPVAPGYAPVVLTPCPGTAVGTLVTGGAVSYDPSNRSLWVLGSGSLVVTFSFPEVPVAFPTGDGCGSVLLGGSPVPPNATLEIGPGSYLVSADPCSGYHFLRWGSGGGVSVADPDLIATEINVTGNGTVTVEFALNATPPAEVAVTLTVSPASCGPMLFNGTAEVSGTVVQVPVGAYHVGALACGEFAFVGWDLTGDVTLSSPTPFTIATIQSAGGLTALYEPLGGAGVSVDVSVVPAACGAAVGVGPAFYPNGSTLSLPAGDYAISAGPCVGYVFDGWSTQGGVTVSGTELDVETNGTLVATFTLAGGSAGCGTPCAGTTALYDVEWLALGGVVGALAGATLMFAFRRKRPEGPS